MCINEIPNETSFKILKIISYIDFNFILFCLSTQTFNKNEWFKGTNNILLPSFLFI